MLYVVLNKNHFQFIKKQNYTTSKCFLGTLVIENLHEQFINFCFRRWCQETSSVKLLVLVSGERSNYDSSYIENRMKYSS